MPSDIVVASAGAVAAAASTIIMYPVDTVKMRLSLGADSHNKPYTNLLDVIIRTWKSGKIAAFYQGIQSKIYIAILQKFLYFYLFNFLKRKISRQISSHLLLGYVAAVFSSIFVTPLEIVQTRLQLTDDRIFDQSVSVLSILREGGLAGLYSGFSTNLLLCWNPAVEYTVFEKLRKKTKSTFLAGVAAKSLATLLTYPLIRAKTLQQAVADKRNLTVIVVDMFRRQAAFKGLDAQLGKVVLTSAIMLVIKEHVEQGLVKKFRSVCCVLALGR
jgi:hypothetical protein